MKPIEIHIEGYKIVISEDEKPEVSKDDEKENLNYISKPAFPNLNGPWNYPKENVTLTPQHVVPDPYDYWNYPKVTYTMNTEPTKTINLF